MPNHSLLASHKRAWYEHLMQPIFCPSLIHCLLRDTRGATMIEFGLIATVLMLLVVGIVEFGLLLFTQMQLEGIMGNVSRTTIIGDNPGFPDRVSYMQARMRDQAANMINGDAMILSVEPTQAGIGRSFVEPELCLSSPPTLGPTCPNGTPFEDRNNNGVYDAGTLRSDVGKSGELVQFNVSLPWRFFTPLISAFFPNNTYIIRTSVVVQNEPF